MITAAIQARIRLAMTKQTTIHRLSIYEVLLGSPNLKRSSAIIAG
jgi:hypothetical protein